ncbi:glycosyltransferase [Butyrivibrio hungatei]|uniref:glycosyltransferase n=1 Tax=Butyrivibrio hungatei TaxID=185008 RepID=UPI0004037772|nr:glycosyltransferase [Butyrivibrio hungatei]
MENKIKTIAYDLITAQPSYGSKFHGGGEYVKAVFEELVNKYQGNGAEIIAFYAKDRFLDDWIKDIIRQKNIKTVYIDSPNDIISKISNGEVKCDVFYSAGTIVFDRSVLPKDMVTIGTFHDLRDFEEPVDNYSHIYYDGMVDKIKQYGKYVRRKYLRNRNQGRYAVCAAGYDKIVCVSEHTKAMMETYLPETRDKIEGVLYTPSKHYMAPRNDKISLNVGADYILMISTNRWIKNSYRAIMALDYLYDNKLIDRKTVLVGGLSKAIGKSIRNPDMFDIIPYVNPDELEYLYSNCGLFLYPTLNEGFGMPPLEAMKYGKTCVISALCSLPELYAGSSYLIDPYSVEEMASHIQMALNNPIDRTDIANIYNKITQRQSDDLSKLADMIVGI